jgi:rhodanese-related sulfurtransferase
MQRVHLKKGVCSHFMTLFRPRPLNFLKLLALSAVTSLILFLAQDVVDLGDLFRPSSLQPHSAPINLATSSLGDCLKLYYSPKTVFVDVRERRFYEYGHIQNALSLPLDEISSMPDPMLDTLKSASSVIVYCNGIACGASFFAARRLVDKGLTNVSVYVEGWPEWRACHLPITMSDAMKADIAREAQTP